MEGQETDTKQPQPADDMQQTLGNATQQPADSGLQEPMEAQQPEDNGKKTIDKLKEIKKQVSEADTTPVATLTLRKILGGDFLSTDLVKRNIWPFVLIVSFTVFYVGTRYQCQQDMIRIDKLEGELKDAKYKALSSSSTLTERCRESQVLRVLKENHDSLLHISDQPPYIINVPEKGVFSTGEEL